MHVWVNTNTAHVYNTESWPNHDLQKRARLSDLHLTNPDVAPKTEIDLSRRPWQFCLGGGKRNLLEQ